jgi:hypothetical protein
MTAYSKCVPVLMFCVIILVCDVLCYNFSMPEKNVSQVCREPRMVEKPLIWRVVLKNLQTSNWNKSDAVFQDIFVCSLKISGSHTTNVFLPTATGPFTLCRLTGKGVPAHPRGPKRCSVPRNPLVLFLILHLIVTFCHRVLE